MKIPGFSHRPGIPLGSYGPLFLKRSVKLSLKEAKTHIHVIGVSGSGKSRFLASLFLTLYKRGLPATLIDPHGDLARLVLAHLVESGVYDSEQAYKRVLYLDLPAAERRGRFLPFNVLNLPYDSHTVARNVLEALRRAWPSLDAGNAPNFENVVLAGTFVLIHHRLPLTLLHDLLVEKAWRDSLLRTVPDEQVVRFFTERYDRWSRDQPMLIESTLRRVFLLAFSPVLRYSLAQGDNLLDFRRILDNRQSLIVNLALGDADARRLLGCLLTVNAEQGALSRAELPPERRLDSHHLILDEFSEFTAQSEEALARILSLCRKYGLYLVMGHQTWSQTSERFRGALQNVGMEVAFRLGRSDAEHSATILGRVDPLAVKHDVQDGVALEKTHPMFYSLPEQWEGWVQAIQDLAPRHAFIKRPNGKVAHVRTLPVPDPKLDKRRLEEIEERYLTTYFRPQGEIERELAGYRKTAAPATTRVRPVQDRP